MKSVIAFVLAAFSAYAFSFAVDLFLGALIGVYRGTAYLPVVTWGVMAVLAVLFAIRIRRHRLLITVPFAVFGAVALFGAIVGSHPHSYGVALFLFVEAMILWRTLPARAEIAAPQPR